MRNDQKKEFRASILDRLLDDEPQTQTDIDKSRHQQLRELRDSVRRDLQSLLNTRHRMISPPEEYPQLEISLLNYGLPDLAAINIADLEKKRSFTRLLEKILSDFEPRFKTVKVQHITTTNTTDRTLKFRIDATLYADPAPEIVVFDSVLDPVSRTVNVEESKHA
jgi:type VI secretion system protein ImpF